MAARCTISSDANLGTAPVAPVVDALYINGGNLHTTADFTLDANRGITLGGNGGELNVAAGTTLTYGGIIASEPNVIVNYSANPAVGRIDKTGDGHAPSHRDQQQLQWPDGDQERAP
jgi:hypothetical protein